MLAPKVEKHNAKTVEELKKAIEQEWDKIDESVLKKMSDRMVSRCNEIIASQGHKNKSLNKIVFIYFVHFVLSHCASILLVPTTTTNSL